MARYVTDDPRTTGLDAPVGTTVVWVDTVKLEGLLLYKFGTDDDAWCTLPSTSGGGGGAYQPLDADLTALAASPSTAGLLERTGAATYTTRLIGVAAGTDVPTRADADTRYAAATHTHAQADVTGLVADLALKAPLASPTFTGVPAMPTAAPGTNTTQGATTAFVTAAVAAGGGGLSLGLVVAASMAPPLT